jgi:hypothetical protein
MMKKKTRRTSTFFGRNPSPVQGKASSLIIPRPNTADSEPVPTASSESSFRSRRMSFQRSKRSSMLGSFRSLGSVEDEDKSTLGHRSKGSSVDEEDVADGDSSRNTLGHVVLHHGEVQTTGSLWRKRSYYLVLTDTHLVRFKSQGKASELFPTISSSSGRVTPASRQSIASVASLQEQTLPAYSSDIGSIPLNSIVSVCRVEDGRPQSAVELSYIDERTSKAAFLCIQLADPEEQNLWLVGIRSAAQSIRSTDPWKVEQRTIEYAAKVLEQDRDYDPEHFQLFRMIQRSSSKQSGRASSDDFSKLSHTVCYMAIGAHKIHLIPLQKTSSRSSMVSLNEVETGMSFGLMTLISLWMHPADDSFQLGFR